MLHGECHLLAASCSMEARGVPATIISAFPLRHFPPAVLGSIPYEPARGITGAAATLRAAPASKGTIC